MHLMIMTRGNKRRVDDWISDLQARYYSYDYTKDPTTLKNVTGALQLGVRPIQLWEIAFPEEHLEEVLALVAPNKGSWNKKLDKWLWVVRKALGLEPLPEDMPAPKIIPTDINIEKMAIGIKKDKVIDGIERI